MAIYDNLPVFKDTYDLLLEIIRLGTNMQRDFRYTIGEKLRTEIMDVCVCIYKANAAFDKETFIREARQKIVTVKLQVRVLHDMKQLSVKQFARLADQIESVSKQLANWEKYQKKQAAQKQPVSENLTEITQ